MRWQSVLGGFLGFFFVGPVLTALLLMGGTGPYEVLLASIVSAVVGWFVASSCARRAERAPAPR